MTYVIRLFLLISFVCLGQSEQQQQGLPFGKLQGWIPKVRRTVRTLSSVLPVSGNGLLQNYPSPGRFARSDYSIQLQPRIPLSYTGNPYQLPYARNSVMNSYRRYRSSLPFPTSSTSLDTSLDEGDANEQQASPEQNGRLRFLGWLFGRPGISRYPDYSMLEQAAGIPYGSRLPSVGYPYSRPHSPVVVEDCVELLDPLTDHIIEECHEVPMYH